MFYDHIYLIEFVHIGFSLYPLFIISIHQADQAPDQNIQRHLKHLVQHDLAGFGRNLFRRVLAQNVSRL
ncbi:hypothetical protein D3C72_2199050 [compost metagenome]